jgi:hypothetical protein
VNFGEFRTCRTTLSPLETLAKRPRQDRQPFKLCFPISIQVNAVLFLRPLRPLIYAGERAWKAKQSAKGLMFRLSLAGRPRVERPPALRLMLDLNGVSVCRWTWVDNFTNGTIAWAC